ncbi:MAG: gluconokinase [Pseudomonadota bacterium]
MFDAVMVMGVSGCGKTTVGKKIAHICGGTFLDGDDFHPPENVAHMRSGKPLTDAMRWPWLDRLAAAVNSERRYELTIFACSALRKAYRDHLRSAIGDLRVVYLDAPQDLIVSRVTQRSGHFMPVSLVRSQFATLEPPKDVYARIDMRLPPKTIAEKLEEIF